MKLKFIAILTMILLLVAMYVPVYAETTIPDPPSGAYQYWVVIQKSDGYVYLYSSPQQIKVTQGLTGKDKLNYYNVRWYVYSGGGWSYENEMMGQVESGFVNIYAANHDIEYKDGSGFFFTLPKVSELCQVVRQMKNKGTFGTILRTISAGLIPLLGCLILGISFRKGWAFLQGQLRH